MDQTQQTTWDAAFKEGRVTGMDHGQAHDYADRMVKTSRD